MLDSEILELYAKYDSCRIVAEKLGVSNEFVRRCLIKHGVKRTGNRKSKQTKPRIANCANRNNCYALFRMLYVVGGMSSKTISEKLNASNGTVYNAIKNLIANNRVTVKNANIDAIEAEYLVGASTYELGEKYGVDHTTIGKWMKKRGHVRGKGYGAQIGLERAKISIKQRAIENLKTKAFEESNGSVVLIEFGGEESTFRCNVCGYVFSRGRDNRNKIGCPTCREIEASLRKKERERQKALREKEKAEELAKDKICESCGCVFHNASSTAKYCCDTCQRREKRRRDVAAGKKLLNYGNHRKRAKIYGVEYEQGITVKKLVIRDNNICQICGEPCDANDHRWSEHFGPLYPTIDHVIAMVNGGGHTWDNVQLAHAICNSIKRDLTEEELTNEVIARAKEQAIANKCA